MIWRPNDLAGFPTAANFAVFDDDEIAWDDEATL